MNNATPPDVGEHAGVAVVTPRAFLDLLGA